jgi:hypothetical protein
LICTHLAETVATRQKTNMDIPATEAATDIWIGFTTIDALIRK